MFLVFVNLFIKFVLLFILVVLKINKFLKIGFKVVLSELNVWIKIRFLAFLFLESKVIKGLLVVCKYIILFVKINNVFKKNL